MGDTTTKNYKLQEDYKNPSVLDAAKTLLTAAGYKHEDLEVALDAIQNAKEVSPNRDEGEYKFFLDKTPIYEDRDAFIYRRATSKSGIWYFRIYDIKRGKPVVKSLKTKDITQAIATARLLYIDIKGKIERGENLKSITTEELIEIYDKTLYENINDIPYTGITTDHYKQKKYFLKNWGTYIKQLGLWKTPLDRIPSDKTRDFGKWLQKKPKETALHTGKARSIELINNNISEIIRMYHQVAIREKYISGDQIAQIDRIKMVIDDSYKRDVFTEEQYEKYWRYLQHKYITKKHNPLVDYKELEKRKIFKEFILILANVGFRSKELLGIKRKEIYENPNWNDKEYKEEHLLMKVRKENSKTGKGRVCVAPVRKRINRIIASYKKLGVIHEPDDYLFINPNQVNLNDKRMHFGRMIYNNRLKKTLELSGLQDELDKEGKSISLYSFRHQYACWRLRYGNTPIHLLSKQMGTSISKIEGTYGHITIEQEAEKITKAQGSIKRTGFVMDKIDVIDEDEPLYKLDPYL